VLSLLLDETVLRWAALHVARWGQGNGWLTSPPVILEAEERSFALRLVIVPVIGGASRQVYLALLLSEYQLLQPSQPRSIVQ